MKVNNKKLAVVLLIVLSLILPGCWDHVDIERRGYVLGVAIDAYPPVPMKEENTGPGETPPEEEVKLEMMEAHTGQPLYAMTIQLPMLTSKSQSSGESSDSSGGGSQSWEITQIGNSFISMSREIHSRTNLSLYYEHLQVIIISDRVARQGLSNILDFFTRDPEMRRRVRVYISKGEAKAVLDVNPQIGDYSSVYLAELSANAAKNARTVHHTDLGQVLQSIHNDLSFVLPVAEPTKDEIKISGAAAFKGDKLIGWVNELETEAIKLIRNLYEGGIVTVESPEKEGAIEVLDVTKAKTKITPVIKNDEITMNIKMDVKGNYAEDVNNPTKEDITIGHLEKLEKEFEREISRDCLATIEKFQQEYKADVFNFCKYIKADEPAYWDKISDKWDIVFPTMGVNLDVDVSIELTGTTK